MSWEKKASGLFASHPMDVEGPIRVVIGLADIVALMREPTGDPTIIVTDVAGGSSVSTIIRRAKAIVSTIGGAHSHIAVVARDYGLPCVVGAKELDIGALKNGMKMRIARNGDVELLAAPAPNQQQMCLLRNIIFAGAVANTAEIVGFSADTDLGELLERLKMQGLVDASGGVIVPTRTGHEALEAWYEQDRVGLDNIARDSLLEEFRPLDRQLKKLSTDWQNAVSSEDWDKKLQAVESLSILHEQTLAFFERYAATLSRFSEYRGRLSRAHELIISGDPKYFVTVNLDSYHTIWFNLHEDLLRLLQRERDPE